MNVNDMKDALEKTYDILCDFEDVLTNNGGSEHKKYDFSAKAEQYTTKEKEAAEPVQDERYSMSLESLEKDFRSCSRCASKSCPVFFGSGNSNKPVIMVVLDSVKEDSKILSEQDYLFFEKVLASISQNYKMIYLTSLVKCPGGKQQCCLPYLEQQIATVKPALILAMGYDVHKALTGNSLELDAVHGKFLFYKKCIPVLPTYAPDVINVNKALKRPVWEDLKKAAAFLGIRLQV